jgi:hypothetical protein
MALGVPQKPHKIWSFSPRGKVRSLSGCILQQTLDLKKQKQIPVRLRSGQAFDSTEVRFAQDDSFDN